MMIQLVLSHMLWLLAVSVSVPAVCTGVSVRHCFLWLVVLLHGMQYHSYVLRIAWL
jgi:hypothetical protein